MVRNAVRSGANLIKKEAKQRAPYDESRKQGTHLRDGIVVKKLEGTVDVMRIGTLARVVPHAHLQEFGWVNNPTEQNAFLRPAVDVMKQQVAIKMLKILDRGIKREMKKLTGD